MMLHHLTKISFLGNWSPIAHGKEWNSLKSLAGRNEIACGKKWNRRLARNEITRGKKWNRRLARNEIAGWQEMKSISLNLPQHFIS
jgi:hypothetical protein